MCCVQLHSLGQPVQVFIAQGCLNKGFNVTSQFNITCAGADDQDQKAVEWKANRSPWLT